MEALNLGDAGAGPASRRLFDTDLELRKLAAEYLARLGYEELTTEVLSLYEQNSLEKTKLLGILMRMQSAPMPGPRYPARTAPRPGSTAAPRTVLVPAPATAPKSTNP